MFSFASSRSRTAAASVLLGMMLAAVPALAQMQQNAPSPAAVPPPVTVGPIEKTTTAELEGAVKNVDPGAGTLQVSYGPLGLFRRTIEVTDTTIIQVDGRQATLADIREGEKVKASYERRETKNVATRVEVMPSQQGTKGSTSR
jgi:Cu/Ag efflux protein CusF